MADLRAQLAESIARDQAALDAVARIEAFFGALEDAGFGVSSTVDLIETGRLKLTLSLDCPAGVIDLPDAFDLVAPARVPDFLRPVEAGGAPDAPARSRVGAPWTEQEDARIVSMRAGGATHREIAIALGRSTQAVKFRCHDALKLRIADASAAAVAAPDSVPAPAPEPETVPEAVPAAEPAAPPRDSEPVAARGEWPRRSPIAGLAANELRASHVRGHLDWLYGRCPDTKVVSQDLALVEGLVRGDAAGDVAHELGLTKAALLERWVQLRAGMPVTLGLQELLMACLRAILAELRGAA